MRRCLRPHELSGMWSSISTYTGMFCVFSCHKHLFWFPSFLKLDNLELYLVKVAIIFIFSYVWLPILLNTFMSIKFSLLLFLYFLFSLTSVLVDIHLLLSFINAALPWLLECFVHIFSKVFCISSQSPSRCLSIKGFIFNYGNIMPRCI